MTDNMDQMIEDAALSFSGIYSMKLDSKGRLSVPSQYRKLMVSRNNKFASVVYLQKNTYKERPALSVFDAYALTGLAYPDFSSLDRQIIDMQGRIILKPDQISYAKLIPDVSFVASTDGTHLVIIPKESNL